MTSIQVVLGVDIGGTNTVFGLVDEKGKCYYKNQIPTDAHLPADLLFKNMFYTFEADYEKIKNDYDLVGIGIGAPSANILKGTIEHPSNFKWGYVDAVKLVQQYYALPVLVTNDANIAAVGEMMYGTAKDFNNFILITLGTGLGSGIVVDGEVVNGAGGFAGEIGHTIIVENGRQCNCGRYGCLETYVSASGICRTVFELLANSTDKSVLRKYSFSLLKSKNIYDAALEGDTIARLAFEITGEKLGKALANSVAHLNPEAIIIFGGLALAGDMIINPAKMHMENNLLPLYKGKVKILQSGLMSSENAAILGSAALVWNSKTSTEKKSRKKSKLYLNS